MLAVYVYVGVARGVDQATLSFVQSLHTRWLDLVASIVTLAGDASVTAGIAAGLVVARLRQRRPEVLVPLAIAVTVVAELILKAIVPQSPPPGELSRSIAILPTFHAPVPYSFPSGHLARLSFLLVITRAPSWLSLIAIVLMGVTRIYLAEHWLSDVIGGMLLGLLVAWGVRLLGSRR